MLSIKSHLLSSFEPINDEQAVALPAHFYTDEDILSLELQVIFENNWQMVGHISQLAKVGDQIVNQIGRLPVVVLLNQDNKLKAFHNVCRHRAGPLATENNSSKFLRCKYHGWTYNLDGQLKTAPEMESTSNFDICQHRLPEIQLDVWQGFIFVCVKETSTPLIEYLEGIIDNIKPIDLSAMSFSHRDEYLIDCNWKVYMDNYLEGYHLPYVHPGLSKILDYRNYHTKLERWHSYQFSPLDKSDNLYGVGKAHYYCVYPNLMLNILPGRLQTNIIIPEKDKTRVIFDFYYSDIDTEQTKKLISKDREFSDEVQQEDIHICEKVQIGLNSGSYHSGPLCLKRESAVLHFQNLIRRSFRRAIDNGLIKVE